MRTGCAPTKISGLQLSRMPNKPVHTRLRSTASPLRAEAVPSQAASPKYTLCAPVVRPDRYAPAMAPLPPLISFVAPSGTGKTTLLEGVIGALRARDLRVAVFKHDAHRMELDKKGKDTWRLRKAGAWRVAIAGEAQLAVFSELDGEVSVGGVCDAWTVPIPPS